jgi:hypothetical protein
MHREREGEREHMHRHELSVAHYCGVPVGACPPLRRARLCVRDGQAELFFQAWEKNGDAVVARLQEHSLAPQRLASVDWRLQINMYIIRPLYTHTHIHTDTKVLACTHRVKHTHTSYGHTDTYCFPLLLWCSLRYAPLRTSCGTVWRSVCAEHKTTRPSSKAPMRSFSLTWPPTTRRYERIPRRPLAQAALLMLRDTHTHTS